MWRLSHRPGTTTSTTRLSRTRASREWDSFPNEPATDNDPFSSRQWNLRQIGAIEAHAITGGSPSVLVGHLDSGVDYTHPDLQHNVDLENSASCVGGVPNQSADSTGRLPFFDTNGHGTFTAGEIVADDNGVGIVGVAPNVRLASVKVTSVDARDGKTKIFPEAAICGLMWAATHGFDVMNASLAIDRTELNVPAARVGYFCRSNPEDAVVIRPFAARRVLRAPRRCPSSPRPGTRTFDLTSPPAGEDCIRMPGGLPGVIAVSAVGPVLADGSVQRKTFSSNYGLGVIDLYGPRRRSVRAGARDGRPRLLDAATGRQCVWLHGRFDQRSGSARHWRRSARDQHVRRRARPGTAA